MQRETGKQQKAERARESRLEKDAVKYHLDPIIRILEKKSKRNTPPIDSNHIERLVKSAVRVGLFNSNTNEYVAKMIIDDTLEGEIKKLNPNIKIKSESDNFADSDGSDDMDSVMGSNKKDKTKPKQKSKDKKTKSKRDYEQKYLKYKSKYLQLKKIIQKN
jgi:hypothetical protein